MIVPHCFSKPQKQREKVDFKALQGISGINISADDAKKGITMAHMELVMKAAGFKEVK